MCVFSFASNMSLFGKPFYSPSHNISPLECLFPETQFSPCVPTILSTFSPAWRKKIFSSLALDKTKSYLDCASYRWPTLYLQSINIVTSISPPATEGFFLCWCYWFLMYMQDFTLMNIYLTFYPSLVYLSLIKSLSALTFPCSLQTRFFYQQ